MSRWRIAGINFDHHHMGDLLRLVQEHPDAEIVGVCDDSPSRMEEAVEALSIPTEMVFTDVEQCLEVSRPDVVILCPATAEHAEWTERVATHGVHLLVEKPFAANLADADRMIAAARKAGRQLAINWPLAWYPPHRTAKRLIDEGLIGEVHEVHYYDGNTGPLRHKADKVEVPEEEVLRQKKESWFYRKDRGGGSLQDYLGYGTTLGTWFLDGEKPLEVTCTVYRPEGLAVDEQSVTVARYARGLSQFETRWGTFTDPWTHQPQPKCGFVLLGSEGTVASYDYEETIRVQTRQRPEGWDQPVDVLPPTEADPIHAVLDHLEKEEPIAGPLSVEIARIGQQIVDTAARSAEEGRTLALIE